MQAVWQNTAAPASVRVKPRRLYIDIETRGRVDLKKAGQYAYAEDVFTQVILMSWAVDGGPIQCWFCLRGDPMPELLRECFLDPETVLIAHNTGFERVVLSIVGPRFLPIEVVKALRAIRRWTCTASRAAALGLPRTLDGAARALGLAVEKDKEGYKLMMMMCKPRAYDPRGLPVWWEQPHQIIRLGQYCDTDVEVERDLDRLLPDLIPDERITWLNTEAINDRGVEVDERLLSHLIPLVDEAEREVNERLRLATEGRVPKVSNHQKLKEWLVAQGYTDFEETGVGKAAVSDALLAFSLRDDLTNHETLIRDVLLMRQEGGKSSAAKYKAVLTRLNRDNRIRGPMVYCGAASTGRFSSRGAQLQNLPRGGSVKDIDGALNDVLADLPLAEIRRRHGSPLVVASELLRPMFCATADTWLARGDYSQIEMRTNYWLSGDNRKLQAFRNYDTIGGYDAKGKPIRLGPDMYCVTAQGITGKPVGKDDPERQYGKVLGLACGFHGGIGAYKAFAKLYNVKGLTDEICQGHVDAWRADNRPIMECGWDLDRAAKQCAVAQPGFEITVRPGLRFRRTAKAMVMCLPSGRNLIYWTPRLEKRVTAWGEKVGVVYWAEDAVKKIWAKQHGWPGIWLENAVQAIARDVMTYALNNLADKNLAPVLTVHDEIVCQIPKVLCPTPKSAAEAVREVMVDSPRWARGMPIAVDASAGPRYVKA